MADIWPIDRVWGILNRRVKEQGPTTAQENSRFITEEWRKIDLRKVVDEFNPQETAGSDRCGWETDPSCRL